LARKYFFLNLFHSSHLPAYEDGTECSEMSAYKIQTPGNHPEESKQRTESSLHFDTPNGIEPLENISALRASWSLPVPPFSTKHLHSVWQSVQVYQENLQSSACECKRTQLKQGKMVVSKWLYQNMCYWFRGEPLLITNNYKVQVNFFL